MADLGGETVAEGVMKAAGRPCANQILAECMEILGRRPETVDELLDAANRRRREQLGLEHQWVRDASSAYLRLDDCNCTLVKAGLARPNPTHCMCSAGMFETLFSSVCRGSVSVEVLKAIGFGDASCKFMVNFQE